MTLRYFIELMGLAALWGASFLFLRIAVPEFGPVWLIEARVLIAGLVLLPIIIRQRTLSLLHTNALPLFITGGLNSALPFVGFAYATTLLSGGFTSILNATAPLFGVLLVILAAQVKQLSKAQIAGFVVGFIGVTILIGWQPFGSVEAGFWWAVSAGLGGALCYALAANYIRTRLAGVPAPVIATGSQFSAALWLLPLLPFTMPAQMPSLTAIVAVVILAVFSTAIAYLMYFRLIRLLGSTRALTVTYMIPLFAMIWGGVLMGEAITPAMMIGCLVILLGTALANGLFTRRTRKT